MNYTFPNTINGWWCSQILKSKVVFLSYEVGSHLPVTMWYFENSFGVVCKVPLRSSSHEGLCLLSPEDIYWLWIMCVQQDSVSWLVLWGIHQLTSDWKCNALDPAWVFICWYRTLWWFFKTDCLMKNSEHPLLQTILNLTLECRQSSDSWMLVSILPDLILRWVISKSLNQIRSQMVIIFPFVAWNCGDHKCCSEFLYSTFKDPNQYYDLWVYCNGFGWMQVYFQVGMIIGDTEQHNKICGFHVWNGIHRWHMCHNRNVTSDDADNPNIKCTRKKWRKLAGLLGELGDDNIRVEWKCHAMHTSSLQA